jgi:hypothetical protein
MLLRNIKSWMIAWALMALVFFNYFVDIERSAAPLPKHQPIYWDAISYYCYLPATFIHGDPSMLFTQRDENAYKDRYWPEKAPNGGLVSKTTMGVAYLYAPFFFAAHVYALHYGFPADGFSQPYQYAIQLSGMAYGLLGLLLVALVLRRYFSDTVVAFSLLCLGFGTNLFNYMTHEAAMSHAFLFFATAALLWLNERWHASPSAFLSFCLGLGIGLITLIRPVNLLVVLVPLCFGGSGAAASLRWKSLRNQPIWLLYLVLGAFLIGFPQLLYWKVYTDQWLFFSYTGERFIWSKPMWLEFLFSYRKGWFVYSPLLLLAVAGLFIRHQANTHYRWVVLLLLPLLVYVLSSWWSWWFGGGYGSRSMVDWYALLIIPFAVFLNWAFSHVGRLIPTALVLALLIDLSLAQQFQYKHGIIHFDAMTKRAYWAMFYGKVPDGLEEMLQHPNYRLNLKGGREEVETIFD